VLHPFAHPVKGALNLTGAVLRRLPWSSRRNHLVDLLKFVIWIVGVVLAIAQPSHSIIHILLAVLGTAVRNENGTDLVEVRRVLVDALCLHSLIPASVQPTLNVSSGSILRRLTFLLWKHWVDLLELCCRIL
jgi:hypothetical protein